MFFALHIPDHTLSNEVSLLTAAAILLCAAIAVRRRADVVQRPSFGLFVSVTALIFAVQMLNFPLLDGQTSGHVLGSAAAVLLLGPLFGIASMAFVVVTQAFALGDGGVLSLGANVLNMAVIGPAAALAAFALVRRRSVDSTATVVAAVVAGWAAGMAAALACTVELVASGVGSFGAVAGTLLGHHAVLGLVEGGFTAALVVPFMLPVTGTRRLQAAGLALAAVALFALTPFSSALPDTLETVLHATAAR